MAIRAGIDPGLDGSLVAINENYDVVMAVLAPTINVAKKGSKRIMDQLQVANLLRELAALDDDLYVALEVSTSRPQEGVTSAFKNGQNQMVWSQTLVVLGISHEIARSGVWQRKALQGLSGDDAKARAVIACTQRLPNLDLTPGRRRKPHDGLADAGALALYAEMRRPFVPRG